MDDRSKSVEPKDPRIEAALQEYLERLDRGEPVEREAFLARYPEIADSLRAFIAAEDELRKLAGDKASRESAALSTRSFAAHGQETVLPQSMAKRNTLSGGSELTGQFGRYRIIRALGKGAMGTVYLAEDTQIERQIALKTPHFTEDPTGEQMERFFREARAAGNLRHPHICPIHDFGQIDGKHFITMAYIEGRPLSAFIQPDKPQTERHILIVIRKLALALQEAHDHAIVHRDLKPANIMVDKKGEPIIMDFGLAQQVRRNEDVRLTQTGNILGTPAFMSPEQVEGEPDKIGPSTDQYSLGVILYELLTGELPFRGSVIAVMGQILTKEPPRPSQLRSEMDQRVEAVCLKMMAKTSSERFASMQAVADELAAILKSPAAKVVSKEQPASPPAQSSAAHSSADRMRADVGASQVLKSLKQKAVTESDLASLEELARKCYSRRDFEQVIQIIERISEERRSAGLQALLEKARGKTDEIAYLIVEIDEAERFEDGQMALKKAEELLAIKPGHHRARAVQEKYSGYDEGGAARIGPLRQFTQPWNEGGWIPWSVLAFGSAVFAVMFGVMVIYLRGTAVVVEINAPGIEVTVNETAFTVKGPGKEEIKVEPGEQQLKITYAGLETITRSFTLKRGDKKTVTVSLADTKLIAKLGNEIFVEQDVKSAPAGPGVKSQSPPDEKKKEAPATTGSADPDRTAAEWVLSIGGTIKIDESGQEREIKTANELPRGAFELTVVDLGRNRKVTTSGLAYFKDCKNLTYLCLDGTQVSDAGLAYFKDCKSVDHLDLYRTPVTDAGLALFKDCKNLTHLNLGHTQVTDAGLAYFKDCKNLTYLCLDDTQVSDAGLANFKDCKSVDHLDLYRTPVTDAGLALFKDCKNLTHLNLGHTQVTDAGLAYFKDCKNLTYLCLDDTQVSDAGLANFKDCKSVDHLDLYGTPVTDAGLALFKDCKKLTHLNLGHTQVTDAGLAYFKDRKSIKFLDLQGTQVSDAGLAYFKDCKSVDHLDLYGTPVTDAGLERLAGFPKLVSLSVKKTNVTGAGVKKLAAALPRCKIEWDGGVVGPNPNAATTAAKISRRPFFVRGEWRIENDELVQPTLASTVCWPAGVEDDAFPFVVFGQETLSDYDLTLEVKKTGGSGDHGIYFHWLGPGHYRDFSLGGNGGIDFSYVYNGKWDREDGNWKWLKYSSNRWYSLKVETRGDTFRGYLDGVLQFEQTDARFTHGRICLRTDRAAARFRRITVSDPQGKVLFEGLPELPPASSKTISKANNGHGSRLLTAGETAAKSDQKRWAERLKSPVISTNSLGTKLALIPPGEFQMGSPKSESQRGGNEQQHRVRITKPFYLGVYEVTQSEFELVMGRNPSEFTNSGGQAEAATGVDTSRNPVENVTWYDAIEFCDKLSEKDGRPPYYRLADIERERDGWIKKAKVYIEGGGGYHLPTEAQWEYACRAGTTTPFSFGTANNGAECNCNGKLPYGTDRRGPALGRTVSAGGYGPNAFGLYDMHGNVWEWCWDLYDEAYYKHSPESDPVGPSRPPKVTRKKSKIKNEPASDVAGPSERPSRVYRGGSYWDTGGSSRSAARGGGHGWGAPVRRYNRLGFRLARSAGE